MSKISFISAVRSFIGYVQALEPGTVVTEHYHKRLNEHYINRVIMAMESITSVMAEEEYANLLEPESKRAVGRCNIPGCHCDSLIPDPAEIKKILNIPSDPRRRKP